MANKIPKALVLSSTCFLISASVGTLLAIATHLPARFGSILDGNNVPQDFLLLNGTALSPDLALLVGQVVLTGCALRQGKARMVGVIGLTILGACYTLGQLGEPITFRALRPASFHVAQAAVVVANIVCSMLMVVFGVIEWRRRGEATHATVALPAVRTSGGRRRPARTGGQP